MKAKMLFVDDCGARITQVTEKYPEFDVTIATCVPEALRLMVGNDFDVVSLDFDLNGYDFQDPQDKTCGMEIVRYILQCGYPVQRKVPEFWIHSTNLFGAHLMATELSLAGFQAWEKPFGWKKYQHGVIAGAFDVIHPGYIAMLKEARELCHKVTILLHDKPNQTFDVSDRIEILKSIKYVDEIMVHRTEEELTNRLLEIMPDVRIVGDDHKGKSSRPDLPFPTYYHHRSGKWSATKYKTMIKDNFK